MFLILVFYILTAFLNEKSILLAQVFYVRIRSHRVLFHSRLLGDEMIAAHARNNRGIISSY